MKMVEPCQGHGVYFHSNHWIGAVRTLILEKQARLLAEFLLSSKVSPQYLRFHNYGFNQPWTENIQEKKVSESSKKQNLNLPYISNYLHSIYIVSGVINNWKIIQSMQEDVHRLHANTIPFCIRDLRICRFWYPWSLGTNPPGILRDD